MQQAPGAKQETAGGNPSAVFFVLAAGFALELVFQLLLAHRAVADAVVSALQYAPCYALVFFVTRTCHIQRLTVTWLVLPLVIFALGWLRWYYALPFLALVLYALRPFFLEDVPVTVEQPSFADQLAAFFILVSWLHLSGSGGHGFQSVDYLMHNGRLHDLVNYHWPVRYDTVNASWPFAYHGENMLVFYLSYYLPAALIGKVSGYDAALAALYLWTLLGLALVLRLLHVLTGVRHQSLLALALVLFAGWDAAGLLFASVQHPVLFNLDMASWLERLDFWSLWFVGDPHLHGFPGNTFQLYFAPHQAVAGWLIACLQLVLLKRGDYRMLGLVTACYAFWSPMMLLMMIPFSICVLCLEPPRQMRELASFGNVVAGGAILALFACYYASGAATSEPRAWMWQEVSAREMVFLAMMPAISCGAYLVILFLYRRQLAKEDRNLAIAVCVSLWLALLYRMGDYNDFMMRGVLPLLLVLLYLLLTLARQLLVSNHRLAVGIIVLLVLPGSVSAWHLLGNSALHYNEIRPAVGVNQYYMYNYEQLGREDSFFFRHLARR